MSFNHSPENDSAEWESSLARPGTCPPLANPALREPATWSDGNSEISCHVQIEGFDSLLNFPQECPDADAECKDSVHSQDPIKPEPLPNHVRGHKIRSNIDQTISPREKVQRVQLEPEHTGWARLSDLIRQKDQQRVGDTKEDIDTLLVFAGLFSAVITAFIIESYKNLQQGSGDTTNRILLQISTQLANLALLDNRLNDTVPPTTLTVSDTPRFPVLVNTLWILSLVLALITASLGILVKQWLHELLSYETHDPQKRLKLRFFREAGLERWQVFEIASLLPLLLQVALLLFFIGLSIFLHELNLVVGWTVTGVMVVWFGFFLFTTLAPIVSSQCPYKTPTLKGILCAIRQAPQTVLLPLVIRVTNWVHSYIGMQRYSREQWPHRFRHWVDCWVSARQLLEEEILCEDRSLDFSTLLCSRGVLQDESICESLVQCSKDLDVRDLIEQFQVFRCDQGPLNCGLVPETCRSSKEKTREVFADILGGSHSLIRDVRDDCYPFIFQELHNSLTNALCESYVPGENHPIPFTSIPMLIRLIKEGTTSATFAILTMYSIQLRTMNEFPDRWEYVFGYLHDRDLQTYGIGDQFMNNLIEATKSLINELWNGAQPDPEIQNLAACIRKICEQSRPSFVLDPFTLTSVFAMILYGLTPKAIVEQHHDDILAVMGELSVLVAGCDGSSWPYSRKEYVKWTCRHLRWNDLSDEMLRPKLRAVVQTWDDSWSI